MKSKAILMALAMMTTALAGCTGGTDGVPEVDEDALNELIQNNLQDFINNTTVVVNQDFHYHNNTTYVVDDGDYSSTVVNEYNNTTNVEGSDVHNYNTDNSNTNYSMAGGAGDGSDSGTYLYLLDIQFNLGEISPEWDVDHRNNTIDVWWEYFDYLQGEYRDDLFTIQCSDYYLIGSQPSNGSNGSSFSYSYWEDNDHYTGAWDNLYNSTISDMLEHYAYQGYTDNATGEWDYHVRIACDEHYSPYGGYDNLLVYEIPIPEGMAISGRNSGSGYDAGQHELVWTIRGDCSYIYNGATYDDSWAEQYRPECGNSESGFYVSYVFETMPWQRTDGWIGGGDESQLDVYVNNVYPGFEYRLIAYFTITTVMPME